MIGWVGWAVAFYSSYLIGEKKIQAFYWALASEALLITDAVIYRHWSLVAACVAWTVLHLINLRKWRRDALKCDH